jgi:hypothetical protein
MVPNASVMADRERRRVDERHSGTLAKTRLEVGTERADSRGHQFDKPLVAHSLRELAAQVTKHIQQVVGFEIAKAHLMKMDQNRHDFTGGQVSWPTPKALTVRTQLLIPVRQKRLAKGIDMAIQFQ